MSTEFERIEDLLGEDYGVSQKTAERFRLILLKQLTFPLQVTGNEDFLWEEPYVLGGWDSKEYEELKKTRPSFTDTFDLEGLEEPDELHDVVARIRRVTDGKCFVMGLSWLKAVDQTSEAFARIKDYGVWHANF